MSERPITRWTSGRFSCMLWQENDAFFRGCVLDRGRPIACAEILAEYGMERAKGAVEALVPVMQRPPGIWDITNEPIVDVVLVPRSRDVANDQGQLDRPLKLTDDLEIIPGDRFPSELILEACDPPGRNRPGLQIDLRGRPLYAFARYNAPRKPLYAWDSDERLQMCVLISRLVWPTSIGFAYAVRIIGDLSSDRYEVIPGAVRGFGAEAWTPHPERNWLGADDLESLRKLLTAFFAKPFEPKSRLVRAMWYFEYVARTRLIDIRIPLVTTALEGLLTTRSDRSSLHFKQRLPQLAQRLGLPELTPAEARRMWERRSSLVHGAKHGGLDEKDYALARRMEDTLRMALRQSIVDDDLRAAFASPEAVDAAFPVPEPAPRKVPCPACGSAVEFRR